MKISSSHCLTHATIFFYTFFVSVFVFIMNFTNFMLSRYFCVCKVSVYQVNSSPVTQVYLYFYLRRILMYQTSYKRQTVINIYTFKRHIFQYFETAFMSKYHITTSVRFFLKAMICWEQEFIFPYTVWKFHNLKPVSASSTCPPNYNICIHNSTISTLDTCIQSVVMPAITHPTGRHRWLTLLGSSLCSEGSFLELRVLLTFSLTQWHPPAEASGFQKKSTFPSLG